MTYEQYAALEGVNWSSLKWLWSGSPLHYRYHVDHPKADVDTPARVRFRAVHTAILEPDKFAEEYPIYSGGNRRGKEWDAFEAANAGKSILKESEAATILEQAAAVRAHPAIRGWLKSGRAEVPFQWVEKNFGIACKSRLDLLCPGAVLDLKSVPSLDAAQMARWICRMGYHLQLDHYAAGARANGHEVQRVGIIGVESKAPYDSALFWLSDATMMKAADERAELLLRLKGCMEVDFWPGRFMEEQTVDIPSYEGDLEISLEEA